VTVPSFQTLFPITSDGMKQVEDSIPDQIGSYALALAGGQREVFAVLALAEEAY